MGLDGRIAGLLGFKPNLGAKLGVVGLFYALAVGGGQVIRQVPVVVIDALHQAIDVIGSTAIPARWRPGPRFG